MSDAGDSRPWPKFLPIYRFYYSYFLIYEFMVVARVFFTVPVRIREVAFFQTATDRTKAKNIGKKTETNRS